MNYFDAAICGAALLLIVTGYNAGLLRSLATIFGYIVAAPVAIWATPHILRHLNYKVTAFGGPNSLVFIITFLLLGIAIGQAFRIAIGETVGHDINILDRLAGSCLGALRVLLVAVTMVLVFDRLIPAHRQPGYLKESRLKPILSVAGQMGLKSLPPELVAYVDTLKKEKGL